MAKAVAINNFLLIIASALVGVYVLDFFELSIPAEMEVAGTAAAGPNRELSRQMSFGTCREGGALFVANVNPLDGFQMS